MGARNKSEIKRRATQQVKGAEDRVLTWEEFEPRLAKAVGRMAEDTFLILSIRPFDGDASYYVQFGQGGRRGFVAEAMSNAYLSGSSALSAPQEALMVELGWQEPGLGRDEDQNYGREWPLDTPFDDVAHIAVRTLREAYGVEHPADLVYRRFAGDGRDFAEPLLGIEPARRSDARSKKKPPEVEKLDELTQLVGTTICEFLEVDEVATDGKGTFFFELRAGRSAMFVSILDGDRPVVEVRSPVLTNVGGSPKLLQAINEINAGIRFARVLWDDGDVTVVVDVPATGITGEDIAYACGLVEGIAHDIGAKLRKGFGGSGVAGS
jgi:hypothetical protein